MQKNINFHIWFRVCKPIKVKYKLSTNTMLVLNGSYILYMINNKGFTLRALRGFTRYYNAKKINYYIDILLRGGYIIQSGNYGSRLLYIISELGIELIKELNSSYDKEIYSFCSKYSIEL